MTYRQIEVRPISGALGAEIFGADLSRDLPDDTIAEIRRAWLDNLVIFFRDQTITPAQQLALAKRFGEPVEYPFIRGLPDFPEITPVVKLAHETVNFGGLWHTDTTYQQRPPMASMLYALELPPYGGDTLFANCYRAYETLSDGLKAVLDPLTGIYSSHKGRVVDTRAARAADSPKEDAKVARVAEHPVVRIHPETGRKALYVSFAHTTCFKGWTEAESRPLLDYLFEHQTRPEFTCRFRWAVGSVALWDNRCALHNPINDYHGYKRVLHRITFAGQETS
ncbi:MAG: TauD/TfdA family dioxygenase [Alphaproteobacteria bacterium]